MTDQDVQSLYLGGPIDRVPVYTHAGHWVLQVGHFDLSFEKEDLIATNEKFGSTVAFVKQALQIYLLQVPDEASVRKQIEAAARLLNTSIEELVQSAVTTSPYESLQWTSSSAIRSRNFTRARPSLLRDADADDEGQPADDDCDYVPAYGNYRKLGFKDRMLALLRIPPRGPSWEDKVGVVFSETGFANELQWTARDVAEARELGYVFGIPTSDDSYVYPAAQVLRNGDVVSGLRQILNDLPTELVDRYTVASWMNEPDANLPQGSVWGELRASAEASPALARKLGRLVRSLTH